MSITLPTVRPRRQRILIGLIAIAAAAALLPAVASARQHLLFSLSGPSHQNVVGTERITIALHCPAEACTVVASATSASPSISTASVRTRVPGGSTKQLTLPLAPRQSGKLKAALEAGKSPTLTVHATARDSAGNSVPLTLLVRSDRP